MHVQISESISGTLFRLHGKQITLKKRHSRSWKFYCCRVQSSGEKKKRGERGRERESILLTYWGVHVGVGNHTQKNPTVLYAGCVEKEGSKADGGKKQMQHLSTSKFVIITVSSNRLSCMDI